MSNGLARTCAALAAGFVISACATSGLVPDSERDTSGAYDGQWLVEVLDTPNTRQTFGRWILNCEGMAWQFPVVVSNGEISATIDGILSTANVDSDGNFLLVAATVAASSEKAGSAASIQQGEITLFISGDLDGEQPSGTFRSGVKQFANNGCRTKARFIKS